MVLHMVSDSKIMENIQITALHNDTHLEFSIENFCG